MDELTFGQKAVGVRFNPSMSEVDICKERFAAALDQIQELMLEDDSELSLMIRNEAIRRIMDAQMWAVKALTWRD